MSSIPVEDSDFKMSDARDTIDIIFSSGNVNSDVDFLTTFT